MKHPEILCDVRRLTKIENKNEGKERIFEEVYLNLIPFELTSLNSTCKDFQKYIKNLNINNGGNYEIYKGENSYYYNYK